MGGQVQTFSWWDHILVTFAALTPFIVPFLLIHWQNVTYLRRLIVLLEEHPLHSHVERHGALSVDGVRYPKGSDGKR